ncbi:hypothetical protein AO1008_09352 [Aspergillus oryzae 100-8]|uniref:Uncharacterized protein n=1 Tax=Aspergillus oryzae (strain 3.042) TaxID=1160506 RepID=I7ZMM3_ASPO3|nr:hypothetical protein Ao3042_11084 [Aspergillus oryzae 3.042]KDE82889.1 hypothetical protein AO1008_09352 [Aspergillus oryzae 100-8]|eukprot:EIT73229.1 hypothetical protein Ao3042_11084 [Aspergillus oryzae 3.042]
MNLDYKYSSTNRVIGGQGIRLELPYPRRKSTVKPVSCYSRIKPVVVDYLDCREALGLYPESWVNKSRNSVPGIFCADATNWGFISYVFSDANIFSSTTQLAQQQGLDMFDSTNLGVIIKAIKSRGLLSRAENAPFPGYLTAI